jgi:hypothetical protein
MEYSGAAGSIPNWETLSHYIQVARLIKIYFSLSIAFFFFIARVLPLSMKLHHSPGTGIDSPEQSAALG